MPFARGDLLAFVEAVWPLVDDEPDVGRWASTFAEAMHRPGQNWAAADG